MTTGVAGNFEVSEMCLYRRLVALRLELTTHRIPVASRRSWRQIPASPGYVPIQLDWTAETRFLSI